MRVFPSFLRKIFGNLWVFFFFLMTLVRGFSCFANEIFVEQLYPEWRQTFFMQELLYKENTPLQNLVIFENPRFGKVLALDGIIQFTEKDEYVYHEMISHVPLLAHGNVKNLLIIGGGDGGAIREILRHPTVERVVLVEIDASVISLAKTHFPHLSRGAFDDPRLHVIIEDGALFIKTTSELFDVILIDSCDPVGPAAALFTQEFYHDCHNRLADGGLLVNQAGVPFLQIEEFAMIAKNLQACFNDVGFYLGVIPSYVGGFMTFGWASDDKRHLSVPLEILQQRASTITGGFRYYTPHLHKAAFALPRFIEEILETQLDFVQ